jgi:dolichol-phosphate mannosyltransferase
MIQKVSVVLPTYNEKDNIVDLAKAIDKVITYPHEIIVVDDNSPDGTSALVQQCINQGTVPSLRLITRFKDRGLTNSIWDGIQAATGDVVMWMDCDFSMPPEDMPKLLAQIEAGYDISVGSRFIPGGSVKKNTAASEDSWLGVILSRLLNLFLRMMLYWNFHDYSSGFIAIKRDIFTHVKLEGDYGEYFIDLIVKAKLLRYKIIEVPYICLPRAKGYSKTGSNMWDYAKRGIKYVVVAIHLVGVKLKYRLFKII